jgi:hypothetical protein
MADSKDKKVTNVGTGHHTASADKPSMTIRPASTGVKPKK